MYSPLYRKYSPLYRLRGETLDQEMSKISLAFDQILFVLFVIVSFVFVYLSTCMPQGSCGYMLKERLRICD